MEQLVDTDVSRSPGETRPRYIVAVAKTGRRRWFDQSLQYPIRRSLQKARKLVILSKKSTIHTRAFFQPRNNSSFHNKLICGTVLFADGAHENAIVARYVGARRRDRAELADLISMQSG